MASEAFDPFANDDDDDYGDDHGDHYNDDYADDDDDDDIFLRLDQSHPPLPTTTDDSLLRHSTKTSSSTNTATASSSSSSSQQSHQPRDYYYSPQQVSPPKRSSPLRSSPRRRDNNSRSNWSNNTNASSQFSNDVNTSTYYNNSSINSSSNNSNLSNSRNNGISSSYYSSSPNNTRQKNIQEDDIIKEFDTAFPSMTLNDNVAMTMATTTDQFGFPSSDVLFPATFEQLASGVVEEDTTNNNITNITNNSTLPLQDGDLTISNLEGVTFVIAEEMSVIHKSHTNQCSVKVLGNISIQSSYPHPSRIAQCNISILDPNHHLHTTSSSKSNDYARPIILPSESNKILTVNPIHPNNNATNDNVQVADTTRSFRISVPEIHKQDDNNNDNWSDEGIGGISCCSYSYPLIEYTCGEKLRPVPMLINTNIQDSVDDGTSSRITLQLRVNPRNKFPLSNAVALLSVPDEYDGRNARVSQSVGSNIGSNIGSNNRLQTTKEADSIVVTNWSALTRILSWKVGELHSGMTCQYEALFPSRNNNNNVDPTTRKLHHGGRADAAAKFPVLLRYDSEGGLFSDVDLDFGFGDDDGSLTLMDGGGDGGGGRKHTPTVMRKFRVYHREV